MASVLTAIPIHLTWSAALPKSSLSWLEKLMQHFFCDKSEGHGLYLLPWEVVTTSMLSGGAGLKRMAFYSQALLAKQVAKA